MLLFNVDNDIFNMCFSSWRSLENPLSNTPQKATGEVLSAEQFCRVFPLSLDTNSDIYKTFKLSYNEKRKENEPAWRYL